MHKHTTPAVLAPNRPPEYQTNCCNYKALLGEEDATCNEVVGSSCASW